MSILFLRRDIKDLELIHELMEHIYIMFACGIDYQFIDSS